jgi:hypothetical protein
MIQKSKSLEKLLYQFTHLPLGQKTIRCPYWKNKIERKIFGPYGGKGTPLQITDATYLVAKRDKIDLGKLSKSEIIKFMKAKKIGIDCSGFIYQMLDALDKENEGKGINQKAIGVNGFGITKTNADCLTNKNNSFAIETISEIRIGDLIRLKQGNHVVIIIQIKKKNNKIEDLTYAHSSPKTRISGVHTGKIKILDQKNPINKQLLLERLNDGSVFVDKYLNYHQGDGVRRLIWNK